MQCHYGITAVGQCECLHVFAGGHVGDVVPGVAVACGDFNKFVYIAGGLVAADIHSAVESRIAVKVKVADCCCGVTRIDTGGGGLQLEIAVRGVNEAHVVLRIVVAVVVMGEVDVACAVITSLYGAVGTVVVIARTVAEAVDGVGAPDVAPEQAVGERSGAVVVVNAATVACRCVAHQVAVDIGVGVRVEEDATAKLRVVAMDQTVGQQVLAIAVNTAAVLCAVAVDQTVSYNIIIVAVNAGAIICAVMVNLAVEQCVVGIAEYAATVCLRTTVVANLRADKLRSHSAQSGAAAVKIAVGFEAVVADDTVADDIGSHAVAQRDV